METLSGIYTPQWPLEKDPDLYNDEPDVDEDNHQSRFSRQRLRQKFDKSHGILSFIVPTFARRHARTRGPRAAEPSVTAAKRRSPSFHSLRKLRQRIGGAASRAFYGGFKSNRSNTRATNRQRAPRNTTGNSRGNGIQNESQRLPDGGGSSRQPQENNNPGGNNYNDEHDGNDGHDGHDENNKNDDGPDYDDADEKGVPWVCPYFLLDPEKYAACRRAYHKTPGSIKQHLNSCHVLKKEKSCPHCRTQWPSVEEKRAQLATHDCQVHTGLQEPMTEEEFKELENYIKQPPGRPRYSSKEYYDRLCAMAYRGTNEPPPKSGRLDAAWTKRPTLGEFEERIKKHVDALEARGFNATQLSDIVRLVHESLHHEVGLLPRRHALFSDDSAPPLDLEGHGPAPRPLVPNHIVASPFSGVPVAWDGLNNPLTNPFHELPFDNSMPIELPPDSRIELPGNLEQSNGSHGYSMTHYVPSRSAFGDMNMMEGMSLGRRAMQPPMGSHVPTGSDAMNIDSDCFTMPMSTNELPLDPSYPPSGRTMGAFQSMYSGVPPQTTPAQQSASAYLDGSVDNGGQMFQNGNGRYAQNQQTLPIHWQSMAVASIVGGSSNTNDLCQAWDFCGQAHMGGYAYNHQCSPMCQGCFTIIRHGGSGGNMVNAGQADVNQEGGIASSTVIAYEMDQDGGSMSQNYAPQSNNT